MKKDQTMTIRVRWVLCWLAVAGALVSVVASRGTVVAQGTIKSGIQASPLGKPFGADAQVVLTSETLASMFRGDDAATWRPGVNSERARGGVDAVRESRAVRRRGPHVARPRHGILHPARWHAADEPPRDRVRPPARCTARRLLR